MTDLTFREKFLQSIYEVEGCPYVWGSKGPRSFDCSGLVTWAVKKVGGPDWRQIYNTQKLFDVCTPITEKQAREGDFVFYGPPGSVNHIMVVSSGNRVYGATGGTRFTTDVLSANRIGACVKFRASPTYRPDLRGFRKFPEDLFNHKANA